MSRKGTHIKRIAWNTPMLRDVIKNSLTQAAIYHKAFDVERVVLTLMDRARVVEGKFGGHKVMIDTPRVPVMQTVEELKQQRPELFE